MVEEQSGIYREIKALQSSILVLRQKLKYLAHNEKILGRNILILNKKITSKGNSNSEDSAVSDSQLNNINQKLDKLESRLNHIESSLELFSKRYARAEDLKEMKYIIDNINPLEYTTVEQVKKIIKEQK
jgi:vacuolar-type H+-ATPase subunit I/STV1